MSDTMYIVTQEGVGTCPACKCRLRFDLCGTIVVDVATGGILPPPHFPDYDAPAPAPEIESGDKPPVDIA